MNQRPLDVSLFEKQFLLELFQWSQELLDTEFASDWNYTKQFGSDVSGIILKDAETNVGLAQMTHRALLLSSNEQAAKFAGVNLSVSESEVLTRFRSVASILGEARVWKMVKTPGLGKKEFVKFRELAQLSGYELEMDGKLEGFAHTVAEGWEFLVDFNFADDSFEIRETIRVPGTISPWFHVGYPKLLGLDSGYNWTNVGNDPEAFLQFAWKNVLGFRSELLKRLPSTRFMGLAKK